MLAYLRLFRIANVFTVIADTTAAYLLVHQGIDSWPAFVLLLLAGCLIYTAGMVLNDLFDLEQDREERPERPLPSGAISLSSARALGFGFLVAGTGFAIAAGFVTESVGPFWWRPGALGIALAAAVLLYDRGLKRTVLGPIAMGSCRTFNLLLAGSLVASEHWYDFRPALLAFAFGIGIYIAGITWFARTEAKESSSSSLAGATFVVVLGLVVFSLASFTDPIWQANLQARSPWFWPGLVGLVGVSVVRRCINAINNPSPAMVQLAVKVGILALIVFDAAVCMFALPGELFYALFVLTLLAPSLWLGRWIRAT